MQFLSKRVLVAQKVIIKELEEFTSNGPHAVPRFIYISFFFLANQQSSLLDGLLDSFEMLIYT